MITEYVTAFTLEIALYHEKVIFYSIAQVAMNSKPEKRLGTESSMGPWLHKLHRRIKAIMSITTIKNKNQKKIIQQTVNMNKKDSLTHIVKILEMIIIKRIDLLRRVIRCNSDATI
jgi:hypothetical protein